VAIAKHDIPDLIAIERNEVTRLRELLNRILNCCEKRCWLCDVCLAAARDVDRPVLSTGPVRLAGVRPQTQQDREEFFRDLQDPYEVTESSLRSSIETGR
jgi:hypothetical protein